MNMIRRGFHLFFLFFFSNFHVFPFLPKSSSLFNIILFVVLGFYFIVFNITPRLKRNCFSRVEVLADGCELILLAFFLMIADLCFAIIFLPKTDYEPLAIVLSELGALVLFLIVLLSGVIRIIFASKQLSLIMKLALIFTWWVPLLNIFVFWYCFHIARHEYLFMLYREELNESRKDNDVCKTKYPLLMVHGIFWRDWQIFNYWGRISKELLRSGHVLRKSAIGGTDGCLCVGAESSDPPDPRNGTLRKSKYHRTF